MKKAFVFAVLVMVALGSCSNKQTVEGEWTDNEGTTWIFSKDGKLTQDGEEAGTYAITATQLSFTQDGQNAVFDFSISADGKTLLLNSSLYGSRALTKIYTKYSNLKSGGRTFTLTDIPSIYEGKYATLGGFCEPTIFFGGEKMESPTVIGSRVSNGKLILPMWVSVYPFDKFKRYSGNDVVQVEIQIFESGGPLITGEVRGADGVYAHGVYFSEDNPVHFSKGSAIKSWHEGRTASWQNAEAQR